MVRLRCTWGIRKCDDVGSHFSTQNAAYKEKSWLGSNASLSTCEETLEGIGALRVMSLFTPDRIPGGFALERRRVTASLESEKQGFRRLSQLPSSTKGYLKPVTSELTVGNDQ